MSDAKQEIDATFLTRVNLIALKYGCLLEDIDMDNRVVNIKCPGKNKEALCAQEIAEAFNENLK